MSEGSEQRRVIVCAGSGGVGKTTTSAALAMALAASGRRVAVLTIDPARRLADAMDVGAIGNAARRVPLEQVLPGCPGTLHAVMLDQKATFDGVVSRFAPSDEIRDRILKNHYYQYTSSKLAGTHEYMAMEKLFELYHSGDYDVVVLDTPPARHALEFLEAPERLKGLFDDGVMRWITLPRDNVGFKVLERGSTALVSVLKKLVGSRTMSDIAEFFHAFQDLWGGIRERSAAVRALLASEVTTFLLVTTPSPAAHAQAHEFLKALTNAGMPFGGFLVNRMVPAPTDPAPLDPAALPSAPEGVDAGDWDRIIAAVASAPARQAELAGADRAAMENLTREAPDVGLWPIPELSRDVSDLEGLREVASYLEGPIELLLG